MKADMAKIMTHYQNTKAYQEEVAKLTSESESLNDILTKLGPVYQKLLTTAGVTATPPTPAAPNQASAQTPTPATQAQPTTPQAASPRPAQATSIPTQNVSNIKKEDQKPNKKASKK
jgi:hypothetical protein